LTVTFESHKHKHWSVASYISLGER